MTIKALIDPKKKELVRQAIERGDRSIFRKERPRTEQKIELKTEAKIESYLEEKEKLNSELLVVAESGNTKKALELIEKGADVNARDVASWTVLMRAAGNGKIETAEMLIEKGADVANAKNIYGGTALMFAANNETAEMLIAKGADVNAKDNDGRTALMLAAANDKTETAEMLRKYGAKE